MTVMIKFCPKNRARFGRFDSIVVAHSSRAAGDGHLA